MKSIRTVTIALSLALILVAGATLSLIGASPPALAQSAGPGGVGTGLMLWLDAADSATLYSDAACSTPVTADGEDVACWQDKSGQGAHVTQVTGLGVPTYSTNEFNAQPALRFIKGESDALRHVLTSPWNDQYTLFIVFQLQGATEDYDSFFSNGDQANAQHFQITRLSGNFEWYSNPDAVIFEPPDQDLKLYTVVGDATNTTTYADGLQKNTLATTQGRNFVHYRINQNRTGTTLANSKIAEVIVYDQALDACERETVNNYLGQKYGKDFNDTASSYDWAATHPDDVNGLAKLTSACGGDQTIDTAVSDLVTLSNASSLDGGDKLLLGHDGAGTAISTQVPAGYDGRLGRIWRIDANEGDVGTVSVSFDLSGVTLPYGGPSYALVVDSDGDFTDAAVVTGAVLSGKRVTFDNVDFDHGDYFTIAFIDHSGLTVGNAAALDYTENDPALIVAPNLELDFYPGQTANAARVEIGAGYQSGADALGIQGQTGTSGTTANGLSWTWSAATGVLSLSGPGDLAKYQEALRQVTYVNTSDDLTNDQRTVRFSLGNGLEYAGNGHFYEFVSATGINWNAAKTAAEAKSYFGKQGYLATVTSAGENGFVATKLNGEGWMGANDAATEGDWRWVTGPEAGQQFWQGGPASSGGQPVSGRYSNWASTEPNNAGDEDHGHFLPNAEWNDYRFDNANIKGYVVEYGGLPADATIPLAGNAEINVTPINDPPTNLALSSTSVDENQPAGTVVGTFDQDDPDGGPTFTYQLGTAPGCDGSDSATFAIDGDQLRTNFVFDYETKSSYQICVRVRDGRGGEATQPFTITVGNQQIAPAFGVQPPPVNGVYGEPYSPYPFFLSAADPEPTFSLYSGTLPPGLTLSPSGVLSGTPTQAGDFIFTVEADNGVAPAAYKQSVHITIEKRPLLVQIDDQFKTQGNPNPPLTYIIGGFAPGDDESVLDVSPTPVTTATVGSPAGLYLIELGDPQPADDNYDILPAINGVLAVTLKEVPTLDWSAPAPITYGTALTTAVQLNATAVGTDSLPLAGTFVYNPPAGTVLDVGIGRALKVAFTPDNTDYIAVSLSKSIDVLPASLTITAEDKAIAAGDPLPLLTAAYSGFVAGDGPGDLDRPVQLSTDADPNRAGTYQILASGARDANYDIGFVSGTLTVTVSADNGGVDTGAPGSHFPYTGAGFAPGETVTVTLTGPGGSPVVTTTATADVNGLVQAGVYLDPDAPEGPHQVEIRGPSGTVTGTVTVDAGAPVAAPQDPDLLVDGRPAAPGSEVPYVAKGFLPGEEVTIQVNGRNVGTTTANPDGEIEVKLVFDPNTPAGGYEVFGIGGNNARQAHVTIDPGADKQRAPGDAPKINTAPVKPDGYVPFEAGGFTPGQQVPILVDGQVVGTATADISGTVKTYVHLGPQTPEGPHTIEAGPGGPQEQVTTSAAEGDPRPNPGGVPVVSNRNPTGAPGGYFPFTGTGYQPGERVTIRVNGVVVGTVTADENGEFSTVIQPDPSKTSGTLVLTAEAPSGAGTQAQATIDPNGPELFKPDGVPVLRDTVTIFLPLVGNSFSP